MKFEDLEAISAEVPGYKKRWQKRRGSEGFGSSKNLLYRHFRPPKTRLNMSKM